ncbi:MAG: hypothetical protein JNK37_07150 [Verrucomicrobiales bacterium]|nr:hypothetical protein [Verrucomicrobiales bacterium]
MNAWLQANFPLTYAGRIVEKDFPCIELSPANHSAASIVEQNFRNGATKLPGSQKVDWKAVSARDALEVARASYRAARVSEEPIAKQLSAINGWLKSNLLKYGCNP